MQTELMNVRPSPSSVGMTQIGAMMQKAVESGITTENTAALKDMLAMYRECQADSAKAEFNADFAALQSALAPVQATKAVPNNDGTIRYRYAPFDELMAQVKPLLARFGFAVSFDCDFKDQRVDVTCTLTHSGGHSKSNRFAPRVGKGPPGTNDAQADGAARTYARRLSLCDALNIVVEHDNDARSEGEPISDEEAADLKARVEKIAAGDATRIARFLRLAGADDFSMIRRTKYQVAIDMVQRTEKAAKPKAPSKPASNEMTPEEIEAIHAKESAEADVPY